MTMKHSLAWKKALIPGSMLAVVLLLGLPLLNETYDGTHLGEQAIVFEYS